MDTRIQLLKKRLDDLSEEELREVLDKVIDHAPYASAIPAEKWLKEHHPTESEVRDIIDCSFFEENCIDCTHRKREGNPGDCPCGMLDDSRIPEIKEGHCSDHNYERVFHNGQRVQ